MKWNCHLHMKNNVLRQPVTVFYLRWPLWWWQCKMGGMFLTSEKHKWRQFAELKSANSAKPKDGEHYSCWSMTNKMALSVELMKPPYRMIHQHYRSCPYHWDDSFRNKVFLSSRRWHAFSGRSYLIPNGTFPSHKQKWHCITPEGGSKMDLQTRIK